MSLNSEVLATLQKAALHGETLESLGLEITDEIRETFETLKEEYSKAPKGSMAFIVEDATWGQWDSLIDATEKAHGPMFGDKTLAEMRAENLAKVRKRGQPQKED